MRTPLLLALSLLAPATAKADPILLAAASETLVAVAETRAAARVVVCVVDADRPIRAVNQVGRLKPEQRFPVDIRQAAPNRVELRADANPLGAAFTGSPLAAKLAGVMISEVDAEGRWLVGFVFTESAGGARRVHAWQITSRIDAPSASFELDLSGSKPGELAAEVPSKAEPLKLKAYCGVTAKG